MTHGEWDFIRRLGEQFGWQPRGTGPPIGWSRTQPGPWAGRYDCNDVQLVYGDPVPGGRAVPHLVTPSPPGQVAGMLDSEGGTMGWRDDLHNFDLTRLTLAGWLVFLLSIGAGVGAVVAVVACWEAMSPPEPGEKRRPGPVRPAATAFLVGGAGFFLAAKVVLGAVGIRVVRPKIELSELTREQAVAYLRGRVIRARRLRLFFLLLMPLGFLLPCGIAMALGPGPGQPVPEGITLAQVFGMLAFGLPVIGLGGWLLKNRDAKKYAQALAVAEHDEADRRKDVRGRRG